MAIAPASKQALDAIQPMGVDPEGRYLDFLSPRSPADLADWEFFSGHSGRVGMARRMAQNGVPTHEIERQGRWKQGGGMVGRYTRGESAGSALRYL